uniref:Coiled-coil domain containing 71 n=1 Tax=Xiphophorus couchianus TaxID=32473 RepID=A0A3B5MQD1_9TELE
MNCNHKITKRRAVHSWSRISSAGQNVLLDALKILSPMSRDLSCTEELVTFLQELSEEGHRPTILRSKDVYCYRSCTSLPMTEEMLKLVSKNVRPATKKRKRKPQVKKREVHPSWSTTERSSPRIQGIRPPEVLLDRHTVICSRTPIQTVEMLEDDVQPCLRLTSIEGLSGFHTARLQIQTVWESETPPVSFPSPRLPPTLSGIPSQPSQNGGGAPTKAVALFSQKSLSCPIRLDGALIGDSAPQNEVINLAGAPKLCYITLGYALDTLHCATPRCFTPLHSSGSLAKHKQIQPSFRFFKLRR